LYIPYLLMSEDDNQSADEVLQSYGVVRTQHDTKTVQKEFMNGVYVPPKKLEGGQWQNEVVLKDSPEANNGDARAQIQPWLSRRKDRGDRAGELSQSHQERQEVGMSRGMTDPLGYRVWVLVGLGPGPWCLDADTCEGTPSRWGVQRRARQ